MEPVVEVVDKREGVWDVVALWAEEQQHSQREVLCTTEHSIQHTWSDIYKKAPGVSARFNIVVGKVCFVIIILKITDCSAGFSATLK